MSNILVFTAAYKEVENISYLVNKILKVFKT